MINISIAFQVGTWRRLAVTRRERAISSATYPFPAKADPSLLEIDHRFRQGMQLDLIDWSVLVDLAQRGSERPGFAKHRLLPAFAAVFELRIGDTNDSYLDYYLGNLPYELCGPGNTKLTGKTLADKVRQCSSLALQILADDPAAKLWPMLPARNLNAMLAFERIESEKSLNAALRPHWGALWAAAQESPWTWTEALCGQAASPDR